MEREIDLVRENYQRIQEAVRNAAVRCGRDPEEIALMAVTKTAHDGVALVDVGLGGGEEGSDAVGAADAVGGVGMGGQPLRAENMGGVGPRGGSTQLLLQKLGVGMEHEETSFSRSSIPV